MCLIVLANRYSEKYKFVLVSNRDEFHKRTSLPAQFWPEHEHIFGGFDKRGGGGWLCVDSSGRLAAVTNIRKPPFVEQTKKSRGNLIKRFLTGNASAPDYLEKLAKRDGEYALFNLLLMDKSGLWHYSSDTHQSKKLSSGLHGLSNADLNTAWPKLAHGVTQLQMMLNRDKVGPVALLKLLSSKRTVPDEMLPNTGISISAERFLSPQFIVGPKYGTRCRTLITIDQDNILEFIEVSFDADGNQTGIVSQRIELH
ncbi:MAG: hypothetical protein COB26_00240 [Piscirickettsiaceae bacterium]|nr:MAG: hypothetical protein COB26_06985 [Piscirickettsiaceae bacterium]PCI72381.1 MAG: hypothetical protein COB26_00240 [Piscirickettsiaceae bacterium]